MGADRIDRLAVGVAAVEQPAGEKGFTIPFTEEGARRERGKEGDGGGGLRSEENEKERGGRY